MKNKHRFVQIDDEGYLHFNGLRITDEVHGHQLLENLEKQGLRFITRSESHEVIVEAFDEPLIIKQIQKVPGTVWKALAPYQLPVEFDLHTISVDEWDRFHGVSTKGIPFVFSNSAHTTFSISLMNLTMTASPWKVTKFLRRHG